MFFERDNTQNSELFEFSRQTLKFIDLLYYIKWKKKIVEPALAGNGIRIGQLEFFAIHYSSKLTLKMTVLTGEK